MSVQRSTDAGVLPGAPPAAVAIATGSSSLSSSVCPPCLPVEGVSSRTSASSAHSQEVVSSLTASSAVSAAEAVCRESSASFKRTPQDFRFGEEIGCGSYSTVYLARDIHNGREVAVKVCQKRHIIKERKTAYVVRERDILNHVSQCSADDAPFFVRLFCTFQDSERLYFVLTFAKRGELLTHLMKVGTFDSTVAQFYMSELVHAVEHLHRIGVIHRDLKPENILLDEGMHIIISDFGSAKMVTHHQCPITSADLDGTSPVPDRPAGDASSSPPAAVASPKKSFVGTAEYASPELLQEKVTSHASDLWALGCILYQMVSGLPPFRSRSQYIVFKKILALDYEFPAEGFPEVSADLVRRLLVLEPTSRLGAGDRGAYVSLKAHPFFGDIQFDQLHLRKPPEIYPFLPGAGERPEFRSTYRVPDDLETGLSEKQLTHDLFNMSIESTPSATAGRTANIADVAPDEMQRRLAAQERDNPWHRFVEGNLILKQGYIEKRKGLFARRRMFLLTTGPRLFYVDPTNMELKGEVPWSRALRPEAKNFKTFFVHTPGRTYYLEDTEGYALEWVKVLDEVRLHTYGDRPT